MTRISDRIRLRPPGGLRTWCPRQRPARQRPDRSPAARRRQLLRHPAQQRRAARRQAGAGSALPDGAPAG
ncbi:MAG: hypothetical protein MZV49_09370 [Rhodopseudomonas palustris]|nr:hypothetical protein [Rhodopseudomonas palustris]